MTDSAPLPPPPGGGKAAWRRFARALRAAHAGGEPASFLSALRRDRRWDAARTAMLFLPFGVEPRTDDLVADLLARGRRACVPAWVPDGAFETCCAWPPPGAYAPAVFDPDEPTSAGPMGIPEPTDKLWVRPETIDLFLLPGLLFDRRGTRLGHGRGWLDRLLAGRRPDAAVLGLAFPWQVVEGPLPCAPHDVPMDAVILPDPR